MRVTVTNDHIKRGVPGEPSQCAIACALQDMGFEDVYVALREIQIGCEAIATPEFVRGWIEAFDLGDAVQPLSFEL